MRDNLVEGYEHYYSSRHLERVARSSTTVEMLAASEAVDTRINFRKLLNELLYGYELVLVTDSRSVFALVSSTKEPEKKRNKIDFACMRQASKTEMINSVNWSP
eukprot:IDg9586t1